MAIIKKGILGGFHKTIANIVGSSWKGIAVIRSKPLSVAQADTAAQTAKREQFAQCINFATSILSGVIQPLLNLIAVKMSGFNKFVKLNKILFDSSGLSEPSELIISQGKLSTAPLWVAAFNPVTHIVFIGYTSTSDGINSFPTDKIYGCIYNSTLNEVIAFTSNYTRVSGGGNMNVPTHWLTGNELHVYGAFLIAEGSKASDTMHVIAVE